MCIQLDQHNQNMDRLATWENYKILSTRTFRERESERFSFTNQHPDTNFHTTLVLHPSEHSKKEIENTLDYKSFQLLATLMSDNIMHRLHILL